MKKEPDSLEITQDTNPILKNSPEAIKFRRNLSTLTIYGAGVIVFGFWNIIKVLGFVLLDIPLFTPGQLASIEPEAYSFITITFAVLLAGDTVVRLIIGLSARAESRNRSRLFPRFYLFFLVWEIIFEVYACLSVIWELLVLQTYSSFEDDFISLFMELTSLVVLIEVYIAALGSRKYKRLAAKLEKDYPVCS